MKCRWCNREQSAHVMGVACWNNSSSTTWEPAINRRHFFKLFGAAVVAPHLPKVELAPIKTYSFKDVIGVYQPSGMTFLDDQLDVFAYGVMLTRIPGELDSQLRLRFKGEIEARKTK